MNKDYILFLDLETTGHDRDLDEIVEVGLVLLDGDTGDEVDTLSVVIDPSPEGLARVMDNDTVRSMHQTSGLLKDLNERAGLSNEAADAFIVSWLDKYLHGNTEHIAWGGSGVSHFDRDFISKYLPKLTKRVGYWSFDVGTIRHFFIFAGVTFARPKAQKTHRALDDARVHAEEFRWYISTITRRLAGAKK